MELSLSVFLSASVCLSGGGGVSLFRVLVGVLIELIGIYVCAFLGCDVEFSGSLYGEFLIHPTYRNETSFYLCGCRAWWFIGRGGRLDWVRGLFGRVSILVWGLGFLCNEPSIGATDHGVLFLSVCCLGDSLMGGWCVAGDAVLLL